MFQSFAISQSIGRSLISKNFIHLGILDESSNFFSPDAAMKKDLFTIGVAKAVDLRVLEEKTTKKKTAKKPLFKDLDVKDTNYGYIESALNKGIVSPVKAKYFGANVSKTVPANCRNGCIILIIFLLLYSCYSFSTNILFTPVIRII